MHLDLDLDLHLDNPVFVGILHKNEPICEMVIKNHFG